VLEEYLDTQCQQHGSDLQANLALLKLYQFNESEVKLDVIATILTKALIMSPEPDFNLCLYLLNESIIADEKIASLIVLQQLIEEARFVEFWATVASDAVSREAVSGVPDFYTAIRQLISNVVAAVYQVIDLNVLEKQLNLTGDELRRYIASQGWTLDGNKVTIPVNEENEAKSSTQTESIKLEQLGKILAHISAH
jgi:translation initiation factor 3 subunit K